MKICTITCHDVYNHGASLQAYALMHYLELQGHEVKIIDYKPTYLSGHYKLFSIDNKKWRRNIFIKTAYLMAKLPQRLWSHQRKFAFDQFRRKYLKLTENRYHSNNELKQHLPLADIYICGSDQIWNTLHQNGKDPAFYLDFVPKNMRKIAYAASFATEVIHDGYEEFVKAQVANLDYVGVRERIGIEILNRLDIKNAQHVMDPTFLLSKEEWNEMAVGDFKENYILIYDFDNNDDIKKIALQISEEKSYKIYSINPGKFDYVDRRFDNIGPETFLALIRDAQLVISNSFHAIIFSIIFEKAYFIVNRKEAINARMKDLLDTLGQTQRLIVNSEDITNEPSQLNRDALEDLILRSKLFLHTSINS